MIRLLLLLLPLMLCTGCTALPAEERAFAVALCVEQAETWRVHGRIPTYQTGGGYLTVTGEGDDLSAAIADMDASAPMHVNLSQLRLLVFDEELAASGDLAAALHALAARPDMRQQCAVALSATPMAKVAEALEPAAGARLSKSLDLLLDARTEQGGILPASLRDVLAVGQRQSPLLLRLTVEDEAICLNGGIPLTAAMRPGTALSSEETALLSLLMGQGSALRLSLPGGYAQVRDASAKVRLSDDLQTGLVTLKLRATASSLTPEGLEALLGDALLTLLSRLSGEGCDVLGLGGRAITRMRTMAAWRDLDWPQRYRDVRWSVSVHVAGPA